MTELVTDENADMEHMENNMTKLAVFLSKWILIELIEVIYKFGMAYHQKTIQQRAIGFNGLESETLVNYGSILSFWA